MPDNLGAAQPAPAAQQQAPQPAPQQQAQQPVAQYGLQQYDCVKSQDHLTYTKYINICSGNSVDVHNSGFEMTITIGVTILFAIILGGLVTIAGVMIKEAWKSRRDY